MKGASLDREVKDGPSGEGTFVLRIRDRNQTQSSDGQEPNLGKQIAGEERTEPLHLSTHQKSHDPLGCKRVTNVKYSEFKQFLLNSKGYPYDISSSLTDVPVCSQGEHRARVYVQLTYQKLFTALEDTCRRLGHLSCQSY